MGCGMVNRALRLPACAVHPLLPGGHPRQVPPPEDRLALRTEVDADLNRGYATFRPRPQMSAAAWSKETVQPLKR